MYADAKNVLPEVRPLALTDVEGLVLHLRGFPEPRASPCARVADAQELAEKFTIGTSKAFKEGNAYEYKKEIIKGQAWYVCTKRSEWAHRNEVFVLRCVHRNWTAFDSALSYDGSIPHCREPVFRCFEKDITQPGWYYWEFNRAANRHDADFAVEWDGGMWAETQVP